MEPGLSLALRKATQVQDLLLWGVSLRSGKPPGTHRDSPRQVCRVSIVATGWVYPPVPWTSERGSCPLNGLGLLRTALGGPDTCHRVRNPLALGRALGTFLPFLEQEDVPGPDAAPGKHSTWAAPAAGVLALPCSKVGGERVGLGSLQRHGAYASLSMYQQQRGHRRAGTKPHRDSPDLFVQALYIPSRPMKICCD